MALTKAFVMLEVRPVIFITVGILKMSMITMRPPNLFGYGMCDGSAFRPLLSVIKVVGRDLKSPASANSATPAGTSRRVIENRVQANVAASREGSQVGRHERGLRLR